MTREEAIKILKAIRVYECYPKSASEETKEAIDMAIEALNSVTDSENGAVESKNDVIKRQDAIKNAHFPMIDDAGYEVVRVDDILALPSAEPKTGEWIFNTSTSNGKSWNVCSECGGSIFHQTNFCPNCGARMLREDGEA